MAAPPAALVLSGGWQIEGLPATILRAGPQAAERTVEFFTAAQAHRLIETYGYSGGNVTRPVSSTLPVTAGGDPTFIRLVPHTNVCTILE